MKRPAVLAIVLFQLEDMLQQIDIAEHEIAISQCDPELKHDVLQHLERARRELLATIELL